MPFVFEYLTEARLLAEIILITFYNFVFDYIILKYTSLSWTSANAAATRKTIDILL